METERALSVVRELAKKELAELETALPASWSDEQKSRYVEYHRAIISDVIAWLHVQAMKINPD